MRQGVRVQLQRVVACVGWAGAGHARSARAAPFDASARTRLHPRPDRGMMRSMTASDIPLQTLPVRLRPGADLRRALEAIVAGQGVAAAFVLSGIGSLRPAEIRLAGAEDVLKIDADCELLTLSGSIAARASHLHMSVADPQGRVTGGHVGYGCTVRTTAEVLLALLPEWRFAREFDPGTGWAELVVARADGA
jgi:predicted DNA-binding protein with PD1-like motif